jgi:hypothetical protein
MPRIEDRMKTHSIGAYALIALSLAAQIGSVIMGKFAALSIIHFNAASVLLNPFYLLSLCCLGLQAIAWPLVLKRFPLFHAYIFMSSIYPAIMIISRFVFGEKATCMNGIGSLVIIFGILLFVSDGKGMGADA